MIKFKKEITQIEKDVFFRDSKLKYKDVARITGMSYDSIRHSFKPSKAGKYPRWFSLVIHVFNLKK
jgi:hypothetical protein